MSDATSQQPRAESGAPPVQTRKTPRIGRSFSSRNPTPIGAIGLVFLLVLVLAAFNASKLPLIGGGTTYAAYFKEAVNLNTGDDVRIAGIKVGKVQSVSVSEPVRGPDGRWPCPRPGCVKATFTVKNGFVGDESTVDIKLKTLLGAKYLNINSTGTEGQDSSNTIPMWRTTTPYDIYPAFENLTRTVNQINTKSLAQSFQVLAQDFQGTPDEVRPVLTGLSRLSNTIASRDQQLHDLLAAANTVTGTLAARDRDLTKLIRDGNLLLQMLNDRRDAIHALLINTQTLSAQLRGLVADNEKTIGPLLDSLDKILNLLKKNQDSLDRGLSLLGPFYRVFTNVIGNGRWFDNYIQNLSVCGVFSVALKTSTC
ncbi:MAG TPA: MCE family protein [Jatrophihabitans sp.]|jgi:phospholipid/cholesterol/gamma-HCH transport system substrate-binding protein|nr:MCE family protein [Jatrophihabitans sp.]